MLHLPKLWTPENRKALLCAVCGKPYSIGRKLLQPMLGLGAVHNLGPCACCGGGGYTNCEDCEEHLTGIIVGITGFVNCNYTATYIGTEYNFDLQWAGLNGSYLLEQNLLGLWVYNAGNSFIGSAERTSDSEVFDQFFRNVHSDGIICDDLDDVIRVPIGLAIAGPFAVSNILAEMNIAPDGPIAYACSGGEMSDSGSSTYYELCSQSITVTVTLVFA
jgi:hypothetical protein